MLKKLSIVLIVVVSIISLTSNSFAADKKAMIENLINQMDFNMLIESIKSQGSSSLENPQELLVKLFDKHFTQEEIETLNSFFASVTATKLKETMPIIMNEFMKAFAPNQASPVFETKSKE